MEEFEGTIRAAKAETVITQEYVEALSTFIDIVNQCTDEIKNIIKNMYDQEIWTGPAYDSYKVKMTAELSKVNNNISTLNENKEKLESKIEEYKILLEMESLFGE